MTANNTGRPIQRHQEMVVSAERRLCTAIKQHQAVEQVQKLVEEEGADISCLQGGCWTPLTLAAHLGKLDIVSYLLTHIKKEWEKPAPPHKWRTTVDSVNEKGETALMCAAGQGHAGVVRALLEAGADVNARCQFSKQTALLVAVETGQRAALEVLLEWGADVQLTDNVGITPLYAAVDADSCDVVRLLLEAGCDVNIGSQDHAPLFLAARRGLESIVEILCEAGCCKDIANKYGVTPLYESALKSQNSIVRCLIAQGCDLDRCDMYGVSPLQVAVMMGNLPGVKMLVQAGACVKWRNLQGKCAVQLALELGKDQILEFFLQWGVDVCRRPNLAFTEPGKMSFLHTTFQWSVETKTLLMLLRGCSQLDLHLLNNINCFRSHPILLELAFSSGLSQPPNRLLALYSPSDFDASCQRWLHTFRTVPQTLKSLARSSVRSSLGNMILHTAPKLPLPALLVHYVTFADAVVDT